MSAVPTADTECLEQCIAQYGDTPYCLELIQFFGGHPRASFSGKAITRAIPAHTGRHYIERALRQLVDKGVVKTYSENSVSLYCLTGETSLRQAALEIARLDWGQWQELLQQTYARILGD